MQNWSPRPDHRNTATALRIIRAQPKRNFGGTILDAEVTGAYTHYWRGRTTICTAPDCRPCDEHHRPRWYGYLAVWCPQTNNIAIVELTPSCCPAIDAWLAAGRQLRGATISVTRENFKHNGRVLAAIQPQLAALTALPAAPNTKAHLLRMWERSEKTTTTEPTPSLRIKTNYAPSAAANPGRLDQNGHNQ